jgi:antitoxin ParD1/3/4
MNITLSPEIEQLVREKVKRGEYDSPDALVGEAVHRLIEEEREDDADQADIRARIEAAEAEIDRGEYVEYDEGTIHELAKDVHERGLERLAVERNRRGNRA